MQQPINTTQVDKDAVIGDVLHRAVNFGAFLQGLKRECLLACMFGFENELAR